MDSSAGLPAGVPRGLQALAAELGIGAAAFAELLRAAATVAEWVIDRADDRRRTSPAEAYVLGLTGAQGSGKTTMARLLALLLTARGLKVARLSIDDLYLTHQERRQLKADTTFYRFRGLFGTHDIELGMQTLEALKRSAPDGTIRIPGFDKSLCGGDGDRLPESDWRVVEGKLDVVIFEGWCIGAKPLADRLLDEPISAIECSAEYDDEHGTFRRRLNDKLRDYQPLFGFIDDLAVLHVKNVENIYRWRIRQEEVLKHQTGTGMERELLDCFVDYFLPCTERYVLPMGERPAGRASLVLTVGDDHRIEKIEIHS